MKNRFKIINWCSNNFGLNSATINNQSLKWFMFAFNMCLLKNFLVGNKILNDHQKSNETKNIRFTMYNGEAERWL